MPTLLQISIEVNSGSVGRIAEQIGQVALSHGWESYISYARNHLPSKSKTIKIGNKWDIYFHGIMTRLFDRHCYYSKRATKNLIKQIDQINPDIIQIHHIHGYFLNMEILFKYLSSISTPVVWVFHDCWSFTGHCAHFEYIMCEKWRTQCFNCPQKKSYPSSSLLDNSRNNYYKKKELFTSLKNLTIVCVSEWLANLCNESFFKNTSIVHIPNGIDLSIFSPRENIDLSNYLIKKNKKVILGVASTWDYRKGLEDFEKLSDVLDNQIYQIVLVGLTSKQISKLPTNVIGINRTENAIQLAEIYSRADVFVNPTLEDTFPTVNLESLACGTPIVTYRTGGSVESVSEDVGFVVDKKDINALVNAIKIICSKEKNFYKDSCINRAKTLYDKNICFEQYLELYDKLLKKQDNE